ncbi:Mth938-like domain-containing protein [Celeribacter halophilus]|uniref:Mth938-like domain-containing protein n=1 Tax=Celeribacter halophilus TaxID=576117 RepID=UPI003A8D35B8
MQFNEMPFEDAVPVDGYGPNMFRIGGKAYEGAMLVCGERVLPWGGYADVDSLVELGELIDIIVIGTGPEMTHLPKAFREALEAASIGLEPMATPTAARTYNVLASEGRRVAVAMLPV